jgi:hypothetical protein
LGSEAWALAAAETAAVAAALATRASGAAEREEAGSAACPGKEVGVEPAEVAEVTAVEATATEAPVAWEVEECTARTAEATEEEDGMGPEPEGVVVEDVAHPVEAGAMVREEAAGEREGTDSATAVEVEEATQAEVRAEAVGGLAWVGHTEMAAVSA